MEFSFFNTPSGGTATPRYRHHIKVLNSFGHKVSEKNLNADVIILWSPISVNLLSLALKVKKMCKPLIYECYYSVIESYIDEGVIKANSKREKRLRFLEKSMFELSDLILVDTRTNQRYFSEIYTVRSEKIIPIYGLVDTDLFKKDISLKIDLKLSHPIFLYHGSFLKVHGVEIIVKAFQQVVIKHPTSSLLLMGSFSPHMERTLKNLLKNTPNYHINPPVEHERVPIYLNSVDIWLGSFSSSPKSNRTARFAMFEAMATECIIITANTNENNNIIKDGVNGYLVPPDNVEELTNKIYKIIEEKNDSVGQNARKFVQSNFDLEILEKIVEKNIIPIKFHHSPLLKIKFRLILFKFGLSIKRSFMKLLGR